MLLDIMFAASDDIMISLINITLTASVVAVMILALCQMLRLAFRRVPRGYTCALWLIVLFRFLCPVLIPSPLSLIPVRPEPVAETIGYDVVPQIETGVFWVDAPVNQVLEDNLAAGNGANSVNPMQIFLFAVSVVWEAGVIALLLFHGAGYLRLRRRLADAVRVEPGIYESERIEGAFVLGILRPVIYLPAGLDAENRRYIVCHEQAHVRRRDYLVKLLGLLMVVVHWFNPLAWMSYRFLCRDMEMACDERVLKTLGQGERKAYSTVLLQAARMKSGLPPLLAFGENHTKARIKNILNYKKPGFWLMSLLAGVLVVAVAGLLTSPKSNPSFTEQMEEQMGSNAGKDSSAISIIGGADGPVSVFVAGKTGDGEDAGERYRMPESAWLANRMIPVGHPGESSPVTNRITLDFASDNSLIFHGDFGMFFFSRSGDAWDLSLYMPEEEAEGLSEAFSRIEVEAGSRGTNRDGKSRPYTNEIRVADRFLEHPYPEFPIGRDAEAQWQEVAARKMADGSVGILGGYAANGTLRLIDLYYGYWNPQEQVMHQVYLFGGSQEMFENPKGEINRRRYLFSRDGYDYFLRTPRSFLEFEAGREGYYFPYGRMELIRTADTADVAEASDAVEEILDACVCIDGSLESQKIILTQDRILYTGSTGQDFLGFKNPGLISIGLDGSDRRTSNLDYKGLTYDAEYLYYEDWGWDAPGSRPICRMTPTFEKQEVVCHAGDASLVTVRDGLIYAYSWERERLDIIAAIQVDKKEMMEQNQTIPDRYDMETAVTDGVMKLSLIPKDGRMTEDYWIDIPPTHDTR